MDDNTPIDSPNRAMNRTGILTVGQLAEYLQVPERTIYEWRHRGTGPRGFRAGKHLRFMTADVDAWITERAAS